MVAILGLFLQLSANVDCGKVYTGDSVLSHGPWPESMKCVWLVQKGPEQKVLKGHMIHSLGWENNSVTVPLTAGHLGREPSHAVGRCRWSYVELFNHVHTPGYWVSSDAP